MGNPRDKLFSDLVHDIMSGEEDLMIAEQNGRKPDQWMQDRIDGVRRSYDALLDVWPIVPGNGTQEE
jgi:hypothetical protein